MSRHKRDNHHIIRSNCSMGVSGMVGSEGEDSLLLPVGSVGSFGCLMLALLLLSGGFSEAPQETSVQMASNRASSNERVRFICITSFVEYIINIA